MKAIDLLVKVTKEYLAVEVQDDCFCDYMATKLIWGEHARTEEAYELWRDHKLSAFQTSPDFTGDDFYAISLEKYGLMLFPDNKFEGEYGQARRRLVTCVYQYFIELRDSDVL